MKLASMVAANVACIAIIACSDAVRDGQFACRTAGSTSECPPGLRCGLGSVSATELRCYARASGGLDAGADAPIRLDSGADAGDVDAAEVDTSVPDASDGAPVDGGPPVVECAIAPTCDAPCEVDGVLGEEIEIELVTERASPDGPLGLTCDRASPAGGGAAQGVVALHLPGSGAQRIMLSLRHPRTDVRDTLLEVRSECASAEDAECFDDIDGLDPSAQSRGSVFGNGGETLFAAVSAAAGARPDTGRYRLSATVLDVDAPRITDLIATAREVDDSRLVIQGNFTFYDDDFDLGQLELTFLDPAGPIDISGDGRVDGDDVVVISTPLDGVSQGTLIPFETPAPRVERLGATAVRVVALDFEAHRGNAMTAPLDYRSSEGVACDPPFECDDTFSCTGGACAVSAETIAACADAERVAIAVPTTTTTSVTRSGTVGGLGPTHFTSSGCFGTDGPEDVYLVPVPEGGPFDLVARTDVEGTHEWVYTHVYVRRDCEVPSSELGCDTEDIGWTDYRSRTVIEDVAPGTYAVIVERYASRTPSPSDPYTVQLGLRPVLPSGSPCDGTGLANRCASRTCAAGTCL